MLLRQIEYLQAVIENGNFYLAAEQCNVSQSAISQQIKKLEDELGVKLLERHNRTFSLTPAGEHFYRKSLIISGDLKQLVRETKKIADNNNAVLRIGYYKGYHGNELSEAIALFSEKYPAVDVKIMVGSHEELYHAMENNSVDLAINDQRRAFSDAYNNEILAESKIYIELSSKNPLSRLSALEIDDLKNTPCILVINQTGQKEEQDYYENIIGLQGDFLFADTMQEARLKIITGQGYMPVDVIGEQVWFDTSVSRIPLVRKKSPVKKVYCAFWKKDNSGYYIEEFAEILKACF
ncbi:LysR family transcriptional regulator [Eubacterium sp. MSJ-13]|uniref:LysR family transcriptional regulator n=1 Tax=Eubacterium sp. MSJ-13 TaxID=2841513 RepID=UPI001C106081|nr:LysR family transcriptional regulator [Eubacterium sp. MSJ-13]MBU5478255.1 LysR family transcriptional regulator [Eubacterium sp. MSJ-13]